MSGNNTRPATFGDVEHKQRTRGSGCAICGEPNRGNVSTFLQEFGEGTANLKNGRRVRSKSVSLCEKHCVEVYLPLEEALLRATHLEHLIEVAHT